MSFSRSIKVKIRPFIKPLVRLFKWFDLQTHYCEGDGGSLHLGKNVGLANTLFNTESGDIFVGDNTIFGYNVMVLTGRHLFEDGVRVSVLNSSTGSGVEVPRNGFDIRIGKNCWISSGAIITGGVDIGDSVIISAGSVVTKSIPSNVIVGGNPAMVIQQNA